MLHRQISINSSRFVFINSVYFISPKIAFNRVSTISTFWGNLSLIMTSYKDLEKLKFVKVGKSGTCFRLS